MGNGAKIGLVGVLALIVLVVAVWDKQEGAKKGAPGMAVPGGAAGDGAGTRSPAGDPSVRVLPRVPEQGDRVTGSLETGLRIGRAPGADPTAAPARPAVAAPAGLEPVARPSQPVAAPAPPPAAAPAPRPAAARRTYKVQESDTLSSIAQAHLGTKSRWREIYEANRDRLSSPDSLVVGMEIVVPESAAPAGSTPTPLSSSASSAPAPRTGSAATPLAASFPPPPAGARTHTVGRGETLSTISEKHYGVRTKWHKIFLANKERLPDPDRLKEGMVLVIPD